MCAIIISGMGFVHARTFGKIFTWNVPMHVKLIVIHHPKNCDSSMVIGSYLSEDKRTAPV